MQEQRTESVYVASSTTLIFMGLTVLLVHRKQLFTVQQNFGRK